MPFEMTETFSRRQQKYFDAKQFPFLVPTKMHICQNCLANEIKCETSKNLVDFIIQAKFKTAAMSNLGD
jgi:hypothetical protein